MDDPRLERVARAIATKQMRKVLASAGLSYEPGQDTFLKVYAGLALAVVDEMEAEQRRQIALQWQADTTPPWPIPPREDER